MAKIISWNLLRLVGASLDDVVRLVRSERPDVLLMQEATEDMDGLPGLVGGHYQRALLPGRIHGLAVWSLEPPHSPTLVMRLPPGAMFRRVCQVLDLGEFTLANVHLSHGQMLNRRQLRHIVEVLPPSAAILGDFNLVGPALVRGFRDVGPRGSTHNAGKVVPLRIDRCLTRGLVCASARTLERGTSDHKPIIVELRTPAIAVRRPAAAA